MPPALELTKELKELLAEIELLPESMQSNILACASQIMKLVSDAGDSGIYAVALVFETVKAKVG
jgi:hypothetical protein